MSREASLTLIVCFTLLSFVFLIEGIQARRGARPVVELALLLIFGLLLRQLTGFPHLAENGTRIPFGAGANPWLLIILVFISTTIGMAARYFFYLKTPVSWASLLKPILVSPIVLLPLLGTLQDASSLTPVQVVSFCLLAFQNGFFWRVVFERAQSSLKS